MWQTIGHQRAIRALERSLAGGRLSHAYLIAGPPHVGKMRLAMDLAKAVNCQGPVAPCGECHSCTRIEAGKHADVRVVQRDAEHKKDIGVDQVGELRRSAALPPFEGKGKCFIIDGAASLSPEAANGLLKQLEEPLPGVLIILLAVSETEILPTLVSRCQCISLRPLPAAAVKKVLIDQFGIAESKAEALARLSAGALGWAISAVADPSIFELHEERVKLIQEVSHASQQRRLDYAAELSSCFSRDRTEAYGILDLWQCWWRDLLLAGSGNAASVVNVDWTIEITRQAGTLGVQRVHRFLHGLEDARSQLEQNANAQLVLENLMLALPLDSKAA